MRRWQAHLLTAALMVALGGPGAFAADDQGRAKGHAKHEQKHNAKGKHTGKPRRSAAHPIRFHGVDHNHDGIITRAEWHGDDRSFAHHDHNHDGFLSGGEVRPGDDPDIALFAALDTNDDGVLSRAEWRGSEEDFRRLDFNKDGVLSPYEFGVGR